MEINIKEMKNLVYEFVKKGKPLFIHGAPGIGKSDAVRQVAMTIAQEKGKEYYEGAVVKDKFCLLDTRVTQMEPADLRGVPFPEGDEAKWLKPDWLPKEGEGILFFDELNLAPPSIQAACYQLILNRRIGNYELPDGWTVIAAGNRAIDKANVFAMAAPLKNRFAHYTLLPPSDELWRDWAIDNGIRTDIIAFMAFKPSLLYKFDPSVKDDAFPTHRTWAMASDMTENINDEDTLLKLTAGCVGEGAALEYMGFVKLKKKVKVDDILKNPKKVKELDDVGLKHSLVSGLAEKYKADHKILDKILGVVEELDTEFGVFLLRMMNGMNKAGFVNDLTACKKWEKLSEKVSKFLL
jgi:MoxR-like ATPase